MYGVCMCKYIWCMYKVHGCMHVCVYVCVDKEIRVDRTVTFLYISVCVCVCVCVMYMDVCVYMAKELRMDNSHDFCVCIW